MGGACEILLAGMGKKEALRSAGLGIEEVSRIERKYSRYQTGSVVSKINSLAGIDWVESDKETCALLDYSDVLYRNSRGLFDVTSGVLRRAWNFDKTEVPAPEMLFPLLKLVGWDRVERKGDAIRLPEEGMQLDFGGIGKEYAADAAAEALYEHGVRHGYVNLAGDIRVIGPKPDGEPWTIGIRDPRNSAGMIASIPVSSGAIATSGDYERFFESAGRRYCHIINPMTGFPVSFWRSVTVLAPLATTAGSCTTIAMLLESEGSIYLKDSGFTFMAVDQSSKMLYHH
jgi:thiamine biosynthesis lipoprotein